MNVEMVPKRFRTHTVAEHGPVVREAREAPPAPSDLSKATRTWWAKTWALPVAGAWEESDLDAVERLARLRDERREIEKVVKRDGLSMDGSRKQPIRHPLLTHRTAIDAEMRQLEDRLGLSPMSRLRLGISFADAKKALDSLNADVVEGWDE